MRLKDKVAIVTGSGKGIGRAIAVRYAEEGAKVVVATRTAESGLDTVRTIKDAGGEALFVQTDVSRVSSIQQMVEKSIDTYGRIDTLVNNAGITLFKPLLDITEDDWDYIINIDLKGSLFCSKEVIPHMRKNGSGSIINISSVHAHATLKDTEIYAAAKGGVNAMTRSMALSFAADGIRVNALCPGFTDTPHYRNWLHGSDDPQKQEQWVLSFHPQGRIVASEDVAAMSVFLASDESSAMTGSCLYVDGGLTASLYN